MSLARFEKAITDAAGNLITTPGFYFSVRQEDVVGSPIKPAYSDRAGASMLGNPSALVDGVVAFHAAGGPFSLRVYGPGYDKTWHYLAIGTGAEADIDTLLIPGFLFEWETATTEPPTAGCIRADNANLALANKLYVWKSTIAGSDVAARLLALATSTIVLTSTLQGAQTSFYVDSVTDDTTHVELAVSSFAGESTIPAGRVGLQREGAAGAPGAAGAIVGTESIYTSASNSIGVAEAGKTLIANRSSSITFALDAAATLGNRWMAPIKNIGTGSLTIDPNGAEQVDGASTLVVPPGHGGLLVCNATGFRMMFLTPIFVGDSGSGGRAGLVPAPAAGDTAASKYLRADGWSALAAADAAAQEAGSATDRYVTPAVQQRHPSAAKAWAYVTVSGGTPTLQASYNVTSITDTNVGRLTVTIGTDFSSANWAALALLGANTGGAPFVTDESTTTAKTAGSVEILAAQSSTLTDPVAYNFAGFGDQ